MNIKKYLFILLCFSLLSLENYAQVNSLQKLVSSNNWDSLFPRRAGTYGSHPQGYSSDFYSYNHLNQAVNEMSDYFVVLRTKKNVWGQLITITRKSNLQTYIYSNVDAWWYTNSTPETIVTIDFEDFLNESSQTYNKRELAAFLANISKETTGGWQLPVGGGSPGDYALWGLYFVHEVGYSRSTSAGTYSQSHAEFPPDSSAGYYGRGPIQLSWNYNYGQFSKFIFNDKNVLLKYPDSLQESGVLAFKSAIWFWMMPQCPKPTCHQVMHDQWVHDSAYSSNRMYYKGFAHTNNIINGGLECRTSSSSAFTQKVLLRSNLYKYYLGVMGFNSGQIAKEDSLDYSTLCYASSSDAMEDYINCNVTNAAYGSFGIDTQTVCGSLVWIDGKTYTKNTKTVQYKIARGDKNGNDSLVLLNLTVYPIPVGIDTQTACNALVWINGITYTSSNDTALNCIKGGASNGCDSIVKLKLTILPIAKGIDSQSTCNSFTWIDGKTYTASNDTATFRISGGAANGCDSLVNLKLTILPLASGIDSQTTCNSFTWIDGKTYTTSNDTATYRINGGAANGCDSLVTLKLTILPLAYGIDSQTSCNSFTWINGKTYTTSNDTATFRISGGAANGCDSLVALKLTIQNLVATISFDATVLSAAPEGDAYQWLDCKNGHVPINGETNKTYSVKINGSYAVVITQNNCADTSACFMIDHLSSNNSRKIPYLVIFPNPSVGSFTIQNAGLSRRSYTITDYTGKVLLTDYFVHGWQIISLENEPAGIYFMQVDGQAVKLVKQKN